MKTKAIKALSFIMAMLMCLAVFAGCKDTVDDGKIKSVKLNLSEYKFSDYDSKIQLVAIVSPEGASEDSLVWTSEDDSVAAVDSNHKVYPVGNGSTFITVATEDGMHVARCKITVSVEESTADITTPVSGVILDITEFTFKGTGDSVQIEASVTPFGATNKTILWSTSDPSVATVDAGGKVTAVKKGTATITATTADGGFTASCVITISSSAEATVPTEKPIVIKDVEIDKDGYLISDKLQSYKAKNPDCVAWIVIPGTNINFAVAQPSANKDEDYYLTHDINGKSYQWGAAYTKNSTLRDLGYIYEQNTVIYGHAGGTKVFDQLEDVTRTQSWFNKESNRYVYLNTMKEETVWQVFACYYTDSDKNYYIQSDWYISEAEEAAKRSKLTLSEQMQLISDKGKYKEFRHDGVAFAEYMNNWRSRMLSSYTDSNTGFSAAAAAALKSRSYGVSISSDDKVLTLSTCADSSGPVRYVLCAKLIQSRPRTSRPQ